MKKLLPNHFFVFFGLVLYTGLAFSAPVQPYRGMCVPYAYGIASAPDLDGVVDDVYSDEQTTDWIWPDQQLGYGGPSDFTAVFHLCFDYEFLYCIAIIRDDVEENFQWGGTSPWMFDNIEFFLQLDTNTTYPYYDSLTEQFRICRGLDSVESDGQGERSDWGYYMETPTGTGWVTEVAIPWTAAAEGDTLPEEIWAYISNAVGFDFHGADSDNTDGIDSIGNRDYQTAWDLDGQDGTEDQAWQNVKVFGYIKFENCYEDVSVINRTDIIVYPNPTDNTLRIDIEGVHIVEIYSINGTKVLAGETAGTVDISSLKSGLYLARVGNETVKFVKE